MFSKVDELIELRINRVAIVNYNPHTSKFSCASHGSRIDHPSTMNSLLPRAHRKQIGTLIRRNQIWQRAPSWTQLTVLGNGERSANAQRRTDEYASTNQKQAITEKHTQRIMLRVCSSNFVEASTPSHWLSNTFLCMYQSRGSPDGESAAAQTGANPGLDNLSSGHNVYVWQTLVIINELINY